MTIFDGTDTFAGDKGISSDRINKTVLWRGITLTTNPTNEIPVDGIFLKTDVGKFYKNTGDTTNPVWVLIPGGAITGEIKMYSGVATSIPSGFLLCDGSAVSRTTFANLFALISTTYGIGNGSTTFNLPDFKTNNRFPRAATGDGNLGDTGGESEHLLSLAELATHSHAFFYTAPSGPSGSGAAGGINGGNLDASITAGGGTETIGENQAHENKPPFIDIHFIIAT